MLSHPGLLVHLALDVAEGSADFGDAFSLSVGPKRPRLLLWYADSHTQKMKIYFSLKPLDWHPTSPVGTIQWIVLAYTLTIPWRTMWLLVGLKTDHTGRISAAIYEDLFYGSLSEGACVSVSVCGGLTCMPPTQRHWKTTSYLQQSSREFSGACSLSPLCSNLLWNFFGKLLGAMEAIPPWK